MNGKDDLVYKSVKNNPNITVRQLSEETGISIRTIQRILSKLKESEIITRVGSDKTGYWKVKE